MELASTALTPSPTQRRTVESTLIQLLTPEPSFELVSEQSNKRETVQSFVMNKFESAYGAKVHEFMPHLLTMSCLGHVSGVAGLRQASKESLFLEQYLNEPIEDELQKVFDHAVSRGSIVEVGNLAASKAGSSQIVFIMFTTMLKLAGYEWIVFSATNSLLKTLIKLGFTTHELAVADPARLQNSSLEEWGDYYQETPRVLVGNLNNAMAIIQKRPLFREVMSFYKPKLEAMAQGFKREL